MRQKTLMFLYFLCVYLVAHGQNVEKDTIKTLPANYIYKKDFSLLVGFNQGKYSFAEVGIAMNHYGTNRHPFSLNYYIANEIKLDRNVIVGPKIGVWAGGGFALGLSLIYYTDFSKGSIVFRPEAGVGFRKTKLMYGYNWRWTKSLTNLNQHQIGLTHCFTLKRLKNISYKS